MEQTATARPEASIPWRWLGRTVAVLLGLSLVWAALASAWIGDDAHITLRTADNLANGHGFRWNSAERVQTNVHALWTFVLAGARLVSGEGYWSTYSVSLLASALAVVVLIVRLARTAPRIVVVLLLLLGSRTFVDYCTSGLENPLAYLLVAALFCTWLLQSDARRRLSICALLTGLLALTRMDMVIFCAPLLLVAMRDVPFRAAVRSMLVGFAPFVAWLAFATFYFGTPFPSVAYAKAMATGIPRGDLVLQGLLYAVHNLQRDPTTMVVIVVAVVVGMASRTRGMRAAAAAVALQCGWAIWVGGDFMAGRFFSLPFVAAVAILLHGTQNVRPARAVMAAAAVALSSFLAGIPHFIGTPRLDHVFSLDDLSWGIADERDWYWRRLGMLSPRREIPIAGVFSAAQRQVGQQQPRIDVFSTVGVHGYLAGDLVHVVDRYLCDPLMVRLPMEQTTEWRIGHFARRIPEGYLETLATGTNRIHHPGLRDYYEALATVTRGDLFDATRWRAMWQLWSGALDGGLQEFATTDYLDPPTVPVAAQRLDRVVPDGTPWYWADSHVILQGGLLVRFESTLDATVVALTVDAHVTGELVFRRGEDVLARASWLGRSRGSRTLHIDVPPGARGFDCIHVRGSGGANRVAALMALRLLQ